MIYRFATMSLAEAIVFTAADTLVFADGLTAIDVAVEARGDSTLLTADGKALLFVGNALADASLAGGLQFASGPQLIVGHPGDDDLTRPAERDYVVHGLGGNDGFFFGATDRAAQDIFGGTGDDTIAAGNGNHHIFGGSAASAQGDPDGDDRITVAGGSSYINGNAGNDRIIAGNIVDDVPGSNGSLGDNTIRGGAGDDVVSLYGSGDNQVNGNRGDDVIDGAGWAHGNNVLHGGQGDDQILAGTGQDQLFGDAGDDLLYSGTGPGHLTFMTGGEGRDSFVFNSAASWLTVDGATYYQKITDFVPGEDRIFTMGSFDTLIKAATETIFDSVSGAQAEAQRLLDAHEGTRDAAALQVGADTFLFFSFANDPTIDSIIRLAGVQAEDLSIESL
jgi:serralysin